MTELPVEPVDQITIEGPRCVLYGGKGGVGKTTMAAATGYATATAGDTTLVVSTDPAHSLSDIYETIVPSEPTRIHDDLPLYAVEIDPDTALAESPVFTTGGEPTEVDGLDGLLGTGGAGGFPGADEAAALHQLLRYLDDDRFDRLVIDTAPTGHTLRLLELPEILDSMLGRLLVLREQLQGVFDSVTGVVGGEDADQDSSHIGLREFREQIDRLASVLRDPARTDFRIVLVPESLSVAESHRLLGRLDEHNIPVGTIVVNRVMEPPAAVAEAGAGYVGPDLDACEFCRARWQVQQGALGEAQELFRGHEVKRVPLFATEVHGMEMLQVVAACLAD